MCAAFELRPRKFLARITRFWGLRTLRQTSEITSPVTGEAEAAITRVATIDQEGEGENVDDAKDLPGVDFAAIDAILA